MKYNRLRISQEASSKMSMLKARTGLTPNILCRIAFCLSLNDPGAPNPDDYPSDSEKEIDRHTLTGAWDMLFVALARERCYRDGFEQNEVESQFRAHIHRGVDLLFKQVRTLSDLAQLMPDDNGGSPVTAVEASNEPY